MATAATYVALLIFGPPHVVPLFLAYSHYTGQHRALGYVPKLKKALLLRLEANLAASIGRTHHAEARERFSGIISNNKRLREKGIDAFIREIARSAFRGADLHLATKATKQRRDARRTYQTRKKITETGKEDSWSLKECIRSAPSALWKSIVLITGSDAEHRLHAKTEKGQRSNR